MCDKLQNLECAHWIRSSGGSIEIRCIESDKCEKDYVFDGVAYNIACGAIEGEDCKTNSECDDKRDLVCADIW